MTSSPTLLIAGAGYLGQVIHRKARQQGWASIAFSQEPHKGATHHADLTTLASLADLAAEIPSPDYLIHSASSNHGGVEQYRAVFLKGVGNLSQTFPKAKLLFTSSTSVYGQTSGEFVTEESPTNPMHKTSHILLEAEQLVCQNGGLVVRLAGLYGPRRSAILRKFFQGTAVIEKGGQRFLNQIHVEDAAQACLHLLTIPSSSTPSSTIYNLSDNEPLTQKRCYETLAKQFHLPCPATGERPTGGKRAWTNKQVSNEKIRATGWTPAYPSFLHAVPEIAPEILTALDGNA